MEAYKGKWTGKLRGKLVLLNEPRLPRPQTKPQFKRYTAAELGDLANAPEPAAKKDIKKLEDIEWPDNPEDLGKLFASLPNALLEQVFDLFDGERAARGDFFAKEGVAAVLQEDDRAHEGMLFAESAGSFKSANAMAPPTFVITAEQYDRIARAIEKKTPVQVRVNLKAAVSDRDIDGLNIIGRIPAGFKQDTIVTIGTPFSSTHSATNATTKPPAHPV